MLYTSKLIAEKFMVNTGYQKTSQKKPYKLDKNTIKMSHFKLKFYTIS